MAGPGVHEIINISSYDDSDEFDEECDDPGCLLHHAVDCDVSSDDTSSDDSDDDDHAKAEEYVWTIEKAKRFAEFQNVTDSLAKFGKASCSLAPISWNPQ